VVQTKILITGAAGFIGFFLSKRLVKEGYHVTGIDNLNEYYDINLKKDRLKILEKDPQFSFVKADISDRKIMEALFKKGSFDIVVNLAAQAGVRYSLENPYAYLDSNLSGFLNVLEGCRHNKISHLVYASSSSVYGFNKKVPFSVEDNVDCPVSLYAATKKSNELMAHTYSHLYNIPVTGLRFFTVLGPWGRPDMAYYKFTKAILNDEPIDVYNHGKMMRDFTYIDDIVEGIVRVMKKTPQKSGCSGNSNLINTPPYKVYNIGNNKPVELGEFISTLEKVLGKQAKKNMLPMQPGDVPATYANIDALKNDTGFSPSTSIEEGLTNFVQWYKKYYLQ
jgi:UDP-glucuronate 4-epimerase